MMFQTTLLFLLVAHASSYTSTMAPVREWASETRTFQPDYAGHYGGKYEPGPWTGKFSHSLDNADGFQQGKSASQWTGSSAYSPYVQQQSYTASRNSNYASNSNGYYPASNEYNNNNYNMYAHGQGYSKSNSGNGYRFYDESSSNRYATPYGQSFRSSNQQANYAYNNNGVSSNPQYASGNYRSTRDQAYAANQGYGSAGNGYRNVASNYDTRRPEQVHGKKVDMWTGSSPTMTNSNSRYLYDYAGRYYNIDGAYDDAYHYNGAETPYRQQQGASYNNGAYGYNDRAEDYRYGEQQRYQAQAYKTSSSMNGREPYNQWTTPPSAGGQIYSDRSQGHSYRNGNHDSRGAYYGNNEYGRYGFDRSAYRANGQMNSFQNSIHGHQKQSWKSPLSPDDLASRKSSDDWSSASR